MTRAYVRGNYKISVGLKVSIQIIVVQVSEGRFLHEASDLRSFIYITNGVLYDYWPLE